MTKNKVLNIVGMMSGTSLDGIDVSLVSTNGTVIKDIKKSTFKPYPKKLREDIIEISKDLDNIIKMLEISNEITLLHIKALEENLKINTLRNKDIDLIGFHGQTIYHNPKEKTSLQIGNASLLATKTDIPVISNLRDNDIACGGQGAPIVPIFHKAIIANSDLPIAVVNIGGVSNITAIYKNNLIAGDVGPGNALIDDWIRQRINKNYDKDGKIASMGKIHEQLVELYIEGHNFFAQDLPKSLDRNTFSNFMEELHQMTTEDGAATLAFLTALSINHSLKSLSPKINKIILTGGGRKNLFILNLLKEKFNIEVITMDDYSFNGQKLDGDFIEAQAMAFIAACSFYNINYTFPSTTGVPSPKSGGVLYNP